MDIKFKCIESITEAVGDALTDAEKQQIAKEVRAIITAADKAGGPEPLNVRVLKALNEQAQERSALALLSERNSVLHAAATERLYNMLTSPEWRDHPEEALRAIYDSTEVDRLGARNGVAALQDATVHQYLQGLNSDLAEKELVDVVGSGVVDREIHHALWEMSRPEPDAARLAKLPPQATEAAKIFYNWIERSRLERNEAGAFIVKKAGYAVPQTHDPVKVKQWGREAWVDWMMQHSRKEAFGTITETRRRELLQEIWGQLSEGFHLRYGNDGAPTNLGTANLAKKQGLHRVLDITDPDKSFEYFQRASTAGNVYEAVTMALRKRARDLATMRRLGPNPKLAIDAAVDRASKTFSEALEPEKVLKLRRMKEDLDTRLWPHIEGDNAPRDPILDAVSKTMTGVHILSKMGGVLLSAFPDVAFASRLIRHTGDRTIGSFFSGMHEVVTGVARRFATGVSADERRLAGEMGVMIDNLLMTVMREGATRAEQIPGAMARSAELMFRFNGLNRWVSAMRAAAATGLGFRLANLAGTAFEELPEGTRAMLRQFKIDEGRWDVMRKGTLSVDHEGRSFLTGKSIEDLALEDLDAMPAVRKRLAEVDAHTKAFRDKIAAKSAKEEAYLAKHRAKFEADSQKLQDMLAGFSDKKLKKYGENAQRLRARIEEVKYQAALAKHRADFAGEVMTLKTIDKARDFVRAYKEGDFAVDVWEGLAGSGKRWRRLSQNEFNRGAALGKRQQRLEATARRLRDSERASAAEAMGALDKKARKTFERIEQLSADLEKRGQIFEARQAAYGEALEEYGRNVLDVKDRVRKNARTELAADYRALVSEYVSAFTTEPGKQDRANLLRGSKPGTVTGVFFEQATLFKGFTATVMRKHLAPELHGYHPDVVGNVKAIRRLFTPEGRSGRNGLAQMITMGALFGYASMTFKDLARGKMPRKIEDAESFQKVLQASLMQSGGLGIYGDLLFGEVNRYGQSAVATLLGPTAGTADNVVDLYRRFRDGDKAAGQALRTVINHSPFVNLFYVRQPLEFLILNRMQEAASPGFLRQRERRAREEGQEYIIPPTQAVFGK